jgi:hypothetical protein
MLAELARHEGSSAWGIPSACYYTRILVSSCVYDGHRKMPSFSRTGRNRGFDLHIMKLVLINDSDDLDGLIRRLGGRPAPLVNDLHVKLKRRETEQITIRPIELLESDSHFHSHSDFLSWINKLSSIEFQLFSICHTLSIFSTHILVC